MAAREVLIRGAPAPVPAPPPQITMGAAGDVYPTGQATAAQMAYAILNQHDRLQLRQVRQWVEAFTGLERNNRYVMRDANGRELFYVKENSTCFERNCCKGNCKAWRMDVFLLGPQGLRGGEGSMTPFLHMERPCTCTCLSLNRPEVVISELGSDRILGSISEPFACCHLPFNVKDPDGQPVLKTNEHCCAWGLLCCCPCRGLPCQQVSFPVQDSSSDAVVAEVVKHWMWGDCIQCLGEWDNYWLTFGSVANPEYKLLLITLSIFIQMRFFDRRNQQQG